MPSTAADRSNHPDAAPGRVVSRLARASSRTLAEVELSAPQYRLLAFLSESDHAASRLAGLLAVSNSSITTLVDGLVGRGLVERRSDPDDRRKVHHCITPAGRRSLARADVALDDLFDDLGSFLNARDRAIAAHGLALWGTALDRKRGQQP